MDKIFGIDLGTTFSEISYLKNGKPVVITLENGKKYLPSVVGIDPSGKIITGFSAHNQYAAFPENTVVSVKRKMGSGQTLTMGAKSYTPAEISAEILKTLKSFAEKEVDLPVGKVVITVPAYFTDAQRKDTIKAGGIAGLEVVRIINEPTAAALAYGYNKTSTERVAVYDLGGGTFDITILQLAGDVFEVLATAGDTFLGGDDIDTTIADHMAVRFLEQNRYDARADGQAYERLRAAAEWAKIQLSDKPDVKLCIEELAYGDGGVALDLNYALTRAQLESMCQPLVARSFDVCEDAMKAAGLRPTQLDNVILVGGSTRIPLLQRMVAEYFGRKPLVNIDPDLVVAQGASLQALSLSAPLGKAALGRVELKKVAQPATGNHDIVIEEGFGDEITNMGNRPPLPPLPPPPVARAARKATLQGQAPPPPPVQLKSSGDLGQDDGVLDTPTRSREEPLENQPTRVAEAVDPLDFQATRMADASGLLMQIGGPAEDGAEELGDEPSGLMIELGDDAFGGESDVPAGEAAPPPAHVDRAGWAPAALGAALDEDTPTLTGAVAVGEAPAMPLLLDVTPLSLGVETVDGYCEHIIRRNAAIPAGQTKMFTTARDRQEAVVVRICQGEARQVAGNQLLGEVVLDGQIGRASCRERV